MFEYNKQSLSRWINGYKTDKSIKDICIKTILYKVTQEQVKYSIKKLKENEQITLHELSKLVKKKYRF